MQVIGYDAHNEEKYKLAIEAIKEKAFDSCEDESCQNILGPVFANCKIVSIKRAVSNQLVG